MEQIVASARWRRGGYAVLAVLLAVLCVLPQPFVARAKVLPQEPGSLGLGLGGGSDAGLAGFAALLGGGEKPIDQYLAIGRSAEVADAVIDRLDLAAEYGSERAARRELAEVVDVHSLTGGMIEIETRSHDAAEVQALTQAYSEAISDRIVLLGREKTERKTGIVLQRFEEAAARMAEAEARLDSFRTRNNLAAPEAQLGSELALRAGLQAQLQAKRVELQTLSGFLGPENPRLIAVQSEVASIQAQIAGAATPARSAAGPNVAELSEVSTEYLGLYRDYRFAQSLYEVYARSNEEVAVEALAGETASDVQVIEAARLDADRKFNISAVAALAFLLLLAMFTEVYAPATGIGLPLITPREARRDPA